MLWCSGTVSTSFSEGKPQILQILYLKSSPTFSASASTQPMVCSSLPMLFCFQITPGGKPLIITGSVPVPRLFCNLGQSASPPMFWCSGAVSTSFSEGKSQILQILYLKSSPTFSASASTQPMVCSSLPMLFCFQITPGGKPLIITGSVPVPRLFCKFSQSASPPMFWCSGAVSTNFSGRQAANPPNLLPEGSPKFPVVSRSPTNGVQQSAHALLFSDHTRRQAANHHGLGSCSSAILQFRSISVPANVLVFWCRFNELFRRKAANPTNPLPKEFANVFRVSLNPTRLPLPHISRVATDDPGRLDAVLCADHDASGSSRTVI